MALRASPKPRPAPSPQASPEWLAVGRLGHAAKRLADASPGPWLKWRNRTRHARAIRWIETYCVPAKGFGSGRPLKLARFQKEWLEESLADGVNSSAMSMARGNGKSTFLAAIGTWATFDPDAASGAPQVPVVATTIMQAIRSVYGVAVDMVQANPELSRRALVFSGIGTMRISVPFTGGEMFPISSDVDGLQGLDPSVAVCDELGFMPLESWNSILLATGKRPRSLVVGIGTPGLDHDNALWHLRSLVLEGRLTPGFRFTEYAATPGCAIADEAEWRRANPAIAAGYQSIKALRTALALSPEGHFRVFRLGQWVDGVESWLGSDGRKVWDALSDPYVLGAGVPTWVGVDVGIKRDSTAVAALQRRPDGRLHATVRLWHPTKDEPVDVTSVMRHLRQLDQAYDLVAVSFDPRFFDVPAKMLLDEGLPMVEVPQSLERMTPACGSAYELILQGGMTHDGDPAVGAQVLNAVPRFNERGFTLAKAKSRGRIDAAIAIVLGADRALREEKPVRKQVVVW